MVVPSPTEETRANSTSRKIRVFPEHDDENDNDNDDDDDADFDDSEDDDLPMDLSRERWLSQPDFGSPEWWSRT